MPDTPGFAPTGPARSRRCGRACPPSPLFRSAFRRIQALGAACSFLLAAGLFSSCVSHLQEAKAQYARAESHVRAGRGDRAQAAYLKAREEAALEIRRRPSAQAHLIRGMAELGLRRWRDAAASFRNAFARGFDKDEEWAEDMAIYGLAVTFRETGLEASAEGLLRRLVTKPSGRPVARLAARGYAELILTRALAAGEPERRRLLEGLLKAVQKLADKDPACGCHRYVISQVHGHLADYHAGFEAAVMARELGLPSPELGRDNDNQILFFRRRLRETLDPGEWTEFEARFSKWIRRWGWPDPDNPGRRKR